MRMTGPLKRSVVLHGEYGGKTVTAHFGALGRPLRWAGIGNDPEVGAPAPTGR